MRPALPLLRSRALCALGVLRCCAVPPFPRTCPAPVICVCAFVLPMRCVCVCVPSVLYLVRWWMVCARARRCRKEN